eukprot:scaffold14018_cov200-Alexandrium_tamarense.AAC.2
MKTLVDADAGTSQRRSLHASRSSSKQYGTAVAGVDQSELDTSNARGASKDAVPNLPASAPTF